ncbi:MAG: iron-sulfur cluster assembly accessory protein [Xanthomonadales bacterium]|nr:iron-sulfur cluster assembly accessory protein [Xanthomonadales bacterium]
MTIELSDAARQRMQAYLASDPQAVAVRLGVKKTGCSGYGYRVDLAHSIDAEDCVLEVEGITLALNPQSAQLLEGCHIDFQRKGLNASFVFANPHATGACGCGESFTVA